MTSSLFPAVISAASSVLPSVKSSRAFAKSVLSVQPGRMALRIPRNCAGSVNSFRSHMESRLGARRPRAGPQFRRPRFAVAPPYSATKSHASRTIGSASAMA